MGTVSAEVGKSMHPSEHLTKTGAAKQTAHQKVGCANPRKGLIWPGQLVEIKGCKPLAESVLRFRLAAFALEGLHDAGR